MLDILIPIIVFVIMSLLIGIYSSGLVGGKVRNYFVAGNIIPFWVIILSLTGQAIEVGGTYDNGTFVFGGSYWSGTILPLGIGTSLILIGLFFAKPLHRMRLLTLADFYFEKYDKKVETIVSLICVSSFMILIASNFVGLGLIIHFIITDIPPKTIILIMALVITFYSMAGGLFAVTWNDVLHVGVGFIGFAAALIYLFSNNEFQVFEQELLKKIDTKYFSDFENGALKNWAPFLALALGDIVAIDFMERVFASKNPKAAKTSCIISGLITIFVGLAVGCLGIWASVLMTSEGLQSENPFLWFLKNKLPAGICLMLFLGLVAACMSTIDGAIMACTKVITKNIIQQNFPGLISKKRLLLFSRYSAFPVTIGAVLIAFSSERPDLLLVFAFDLVFASCLVPLFLGIYWKKSTAQAAWYSILISVSLRIGLEFIAAKDLIDPSFEGVQTLLPPVVSLFVFVVISFITSEKKPEVISHV